MFPEGYQVRPLAIEDAAALAASYARNREHLDRWDPIRDADFYTEPGQAEFLRKRLELTEMGIFECWAIWHGDEVVGTANMQNIVRGSMQGGTVGYWVDHEHLRRGLATAATAHLIERGHALGLHRLEAGTMVENLASQGVLLKCGFVQYGTVPKFLYIAGDWRDHHLYQLILHDGPPRGRG